MPRSIFWARTLAAIVLVCCSPTLGRASDWPQSRHDTRRSAASADELPRQLHLYWSLELPRLEPAWPDQPQMQFDAAYEPIVADQRLFIGSSHDDSVAAYDTRTGEELWRQYANGPVRFAPLVWQDKLYFVSDDGSLHCLRVGDGSLVWKFRGAPSDRRTLGNERLVSAWPARGAPVIEDGKLYFAAGIWPFMGIFLHALDAATGELLWTNDGDGSIYITQPHNADSFAGVAPQGAFAAVGSKLLIPGGRSVPACYDRESGKLQYFELAANAKRGGGSTVTATDRFWFNGGAAFELSTGQHLGAVGKLLATSGDLFFDYANLRLRTLDLKSSEIKLVEGLDRKGQKTQTAKWSIDELSEVEICELTCLIKAGSRLYAGSEGRVLSFDLPLPEEGEAAPAWEIEIDGTPANLAAADDKLFVATLEGRIYCLGDAATAPPSLLQSDTVVAQLSDDELNSKVARLLETTRVREGYCLLIGEDAGRMALPLARASDLRIVAIEPDEQRARELRDSLRAAGFSGRRAAVLVAEPSQAELPPYFASLIVAESLPADREERAALLASLFASLRPYGGVACFPFQGEDATLLANDVKRLAPPGGVWKQIGSTTLLVREGALPGSANWTHEHADAANTRVSKDSLVKAPLGLLWFGGPSNDGILPRHGHGPQPQAVDGRLFIEGVDMLRATDVYTGRLLWEASLPGVGEIYDNTAHQPGANAAGTNYIATPHGVYVAYKDSCVLLDPTTGRTLAEFKLPSTDGAADEPRWGYLNVSGDYLVGGAEPLFDENWIRVAKRSLASRASEPKNVSAAIVSAVKTAVSMPTQANNDNFSSSSRLVVMDRRTGKPLWTATARSGFRHNAICIGGGRLYCIDRLSGPQSSRYQRGEEPPHKPRLTAFNLATGDEIWSTEEDVFGAWLSFSEEFDVLVEAGRPARDTLGDEPKGMRAYRAADGGALWGNSGLTGPAMLHHDAILMQGKACDLLTGAPRLREHPLSGEPVEWTWARNYGCNTPMASEHLLTFRSGAAGYFDLCNDGGTGNFGGFRSSCSNNLIVACGVLSAPEYTRTCICGYQNQTSVALVPMQDVETWTFASAQPAKQPVRRVGINLGAPGDRKADDGVLWLDIPSVGGASPPIETTLLPEQLEWFRRHSSQISGTGLHWVAASAAKGLESVRIKLSDARGARRYVVRLHFVEPDDVRQGERLFGVRIQGESAIDSLDVVREAGGRNRSLVKEVRGVEVAQDLLIELLPDAAAKVRAAVLCGVEVLAEGW